MKHFGGSFVRYFGGSLARHFGGSFVELWIFGGTLVDLFSGTFVISLVELWYAGLLFYSVIQKCDYIFRAIKLISRLKCIPFALFRALKWCFFSRLDPARGSAAP